MWSQIHFRPFRPNPADFLFFFAFQKNVIFCGVPIYTRKRIFQKTHLKMWFDGFVHIFDYDWINSFFKSSRTWRSREFRFTLGPYRKQIPSKGPWLHARWNGICGDFQDAQEDLERREKNRNKRRAMMMWKNALDEQWRNRPIEATRKIIDRQPKIMRAIIEADGARTSY